MLPWFPHDGKDSKKHVVSWDAAGVFVLLLFGTICLIMLILPGIQWLKGLIR